MSGHVQASRVSVVVPTYKRAHLISRAVKSILAQTCQDFDLIVVNDGPPDGTAEVLASFGDKRIRMIQHERNLGSSGARNTGIRESRGEYIAFLDSDDEWLPTKLEKQLRAFQAAPPEVGVVYTERYSTIDSVKFTVPPAPIKKRGGDLRAEMLQVTAITPQTAMVRAECFAKVGLFDEALPPLEDWDLWIRMSKHYHFIFINEPLVVVHSDPGEDHISAHPGAVSAALEAIITKHLEDFRQAGRRTLARQYYWLGSLLCRSERWDRGRRFLWLAVKTYPFRMKPAAAAVLATFEIRPATIASALARQRARLVR